ncbi:family S33 serine peptidase [Burkholderia lata]|uniref:alpha/beta fold hydrolase n=1 Tax=Burkholderia lata (strain ATCC 17760 / DSM 23089 / LMG 22485 / NCIMB 9086 / R18194 / 383) TaxID=482957 RepID=UPI0014530BBF|nr:alpha/beta hydrolase [Burkholderia lata]VWD35963.1 family S33 serine peptidase [Burkholderia lata]
MSISKAAIVAAALGSAAVVSNSTSAVAAEVQKPTVVLVHGAFADGSTWNKVIPLLQEKGLNVVAVQNPLSSLADDVKATQRVLDQQTGPVVLVAHSWGGAVITQAGERDNVKALVYVAAFAPSEGQSVADVSKDYPTPSGFSHIVADKDGFLTLSLEGVQKHLAQDVPAEQTRLMYATQTPTRGKNFEEKVTAAAWKTKPSWYVVSEQDHMLDPALQVAMAKKISAHVTTLRASHAPHLSQPSDIAKVILDATAAVSK